MPAETPPARKGRKMPQVLEGARTIFLRDGFEGASVDDIARAAGVSKATLYSYFPDKRLLFLEVAKAECLRQSEEAVALITADLAPRAVLTLAATRIVAFVLSDFGIRTYRICVAEADRFPELGHEFYESGPALVRQRIVDYLAQAVGRGELAIDDLELAADQFAELCKADLFNRIVFGVGNSVSEAERQKVAQGAVEMFLARYAPRP
ncbi:TetR family transcriptional regulator [Rhodobacter sphaeroides]|jgi:transcriptional regulator, TetR family|uniref:Transcriptional regulator, TetR family n=1 Tax=Cereibacter sphaeroides (strain ATCC 17023 / DSM 158 / JCM 6121 / CCUG 31486 / LMG 2827 / NBRC 12203 / NCIMB 8253 / ATH 2.4.1.) TaxID=272943 RepID=Q3IZK4_CERS4|nr:TetR/AcrR family transcriptional regulator [Cereibacter sphaeroides]ABA80030.1 transcriptional regulator, TetR family [Cereibacter sphaeroides 2.4.1]ANS35003.1 TetR family transcriptional regulator [Cereibacter sphaeroides]ATN64053.1 TetR family transcriptional regulator [Cereibacter sphaeroides]AXC62230.1 TetR/AcrR family transcriptional regulator [Cereibacter sphaeroides 2.4.1]MVX46822.1 TetR family transcriptional regulator [Cereibacter sphaeroides]